MYIIQPVSDAHPLMTPLEAKLFQQTESVGNPHCLEFLGSFPDRFNANLGASRVVIAPGS